MPRKNHDAIIEQTDDTTISANLVSGRITIETTFEKHHGSPERALVEALWVLRDGRIRDRRAARTTAALLEAAGSLERALNAEL